MTNIINKNRLLVRLQAGSAFRRFLYICLVPAALACQSKERLDPEIEKLGRATGPVEPSASAPGVGTSPVATMVHSGKVLETMDASRYTYLKIEFGKGRQVWAAIPQAKISVGQQVDVVESIVMQDFSSPTLNRTFNSIIFGTLKNSPRDGGVSGEDTPPNLPPDHPPIDKLNTKEKL
jgi:hypothetical protein